jgi:3-hydroxyacyl-[acyl-carrier-protein] dehydratase
MAKLIYKNIKQILPHRRPMLMIDSYKKIDNDTASSGIHLKPSNYGCENGYVLESMLIESVAQTVAAHFGYKSLEKEGNDPDIGMLTNVDTFIFYEKVKDTSKIDIGILKTDKVGAFKLITGEIFVNGKLVAKGQIKVFNPGEKVNN